MQNIYSFTDYRSFVAAWYAERKKARPKVTYRRIAEALGFNSAAHVLMVLRNKANLTIEQAKHLAVFIGLTKKETHYFLEMVQYNQERTSEGKERHLRKMVKLNSNGTVLLGPDQYEYYRKWYYAAVHDILSFAPFKGDFSALAKMVKPSITRRQAESAVTLLERLLFICKQADGTYRCNYPGISAYAEGSSIALGTYAAAMMDRAKDALQNFPGDERSISWAGFSMSKETFILVQAEAREFRKRVIALARADASPDRAYHLNMQIFPVSEQLDQQPEEDEK